MATTMKVPRRLPLLFVPENVLLPGSSMRIPVRSMRNMNMVKSRLLAKNTLGSTIIGVVPKEPGEEGDDLSAMHSIGTAAVVVQVTGTNWPQPAYTLLATGLCRFRVDALLQETPYPVARITQLDKLPGEETDEDLLNKSDIADLAENFREQAAKLVDMLDISIPVVAKLKRMLDNLPGQHLPDICASIVKASHAEKLQVLDALDISERFKKTLPLLMRQIEGLQLLQNARKNDLTAVSRKQPDVIRRAFRKDVAGDDPDDDVDEIAELENKIKSAGMTEDAQKASMKELKRLKKMPQQMPEHAMIRNYLDLVVELPWSKESPDTLDIAKARNDLDEDHYGLDKLKKRVIEFLAVRQLKQSLKGPILCFVGPPGVGKTSVGRSIARTLGRQFHRVALGGVCDQSDIRGHRRTYIGSMPGRIIQGLKQAGTRNPVFLLDEVDKLGKSIQGDPSAALLEVLDPEQNHAFVDHYLNVPFDLSQVLFIATANSMASIPHALLDRTEVIQIPGYTQEEKFHIARRHLVDKQLKEHGLTAGHIQLPDEAIKLIAAKYTREAGVRTLERKIGAICRAVAVKVAEHSVRDTAVKDGAKVLEKAVDERRSGEIRNDETETVDLANVASMPLPPELPIVIDDHAVEDILGPPMYDSEIPERPAQPGVAIGLAWTAMGGELLFVEATSMEGEGKLTLTGQLGDVMKESANLALNWVRGHALQIGLSGRHVTDKMDIHIHFPAGAISKDGPSAGVTIVTVLVSLFTGRCVRSDTAMTGEVTLRGLVLPIGGVKEKVLAAHRAGLTRVILPQRNEKDLHEVPPNVKKELTFVFASRLEDVLNGAFVGGFPGFDKQSQVSSKL